MGVVEGEHRGLLKNVKDLDVGLVRTYYEIFHVILEIKGVYLTIENDL
jgi:hypothetical protein